MLKTLQVAVVLAAVDRMSTVINSAVGNAINKMNTLSAKTDALSKQAFGFGRDAVGMGVGIGAALAIPVKSAMEFESGMTNVRKVVDGLKDETAFKDFSQQVLQLGREIPLAYNELTDLIAAGGRMDIPRDKLIQYTRDVAKMAVAFEAPAGEISEKMGKLAKTFDMPIEKIGALGDAINYLDDNSIAKGTDIIEVMTRVSGTARQVGLNAPEVAALASTFLTLGNSAEVAATASNAMLRELAIAQIQPERFQTALKTLGMTAADVQKRMTTDPQNTLLGVLDAINKLPKDKQITVSTQLFGKEYGDDAGKLAQNVKEYRRQLDLLKDSKLKGSMGAEFAARLNTSAAKVALFKNNIAEASVKIGNALLPVLSNLITAVQPLILQFAAWAERNPELISQIGRAAVVVGGLSLGVGALSFAFGAVSKTVSMVSAPFKALSWLMDNKTKIAFRLVGIMGKFSSAFGLVGRAFTMLGGVVRAVTVIMMANPILAIATGIAIAAYLIYENWDAIVPFFKDLWAGVTDIFGGAIDSIVSFGTAFFDAGVSIMSSLIAGVKSMAFGVIDTITTPLRAIGNAFGVDLSAQSVYDNVAGWIGGDAAPAVAGAGGGMNNTVAMQMSRQAQQPQRPTPNQKGNGTQQTVNYAPNITLNGNYTPEQRDEFMKLLEQNKSDVLRSLAEFQRQQERKKMN